MKKYILIGIGGTLGAMTRFGIGSVHIWDFQEKFPVNTLFVNATGSFLLLLILTIVFEVLVFDPDVRLGISTGFLGAYTTFSTLCKEAVVFILNGEYFQAGAYITASVVLGLGFAYLGVVLARKIIVQMTGVE